ncbi:MAG: hypothetical protein LBS20_16040 [Prevotella sp.]|jgi:hypothetical protein|nr:hypothetical protein [Prevotella sp.]
MAKIKSIPKVGKLYIERSEQFQLKQIVSDFFEKVIELSTKNAANHIFSMNYPTFCYGELQIHSIIVPAIAKLTDCFVLEYPIQRGKDANSGRVDYYCVNRVGTNSEYHLFWELKCGRQGIPNNSFRKKNIELWKEVNEQLDGIAQEIKTSSDFYNKPTIRACMEIIVLYSDKAKQVKIETYCDSILKNALDVSIQALKSTGITPNMSVLWKFHPDIVRHAEDEFNDSRKYWGLLFLCRIMPNLQ